MDARHVIEAHEAGYLLAKVGRDSKRGLGKWNEEGPSLREVLWHLRQGGNVALRMGPAKDGTRLCVIDIDSKSSRLMRKAREMGFSSSMEVITASSSRKRHVYGRVPDNITELRSRIKAAGLSLDVKLTGLVLFPPSRIGDGVYRLPRGKRVLTPAELPVFDRLGELLGPVTETRERAELVLAPTEDRLLRYVDRIEPSIQGANGSRAVIVAALKILSLVDGDVGRAWPLLVAYNRSGQCVPHWDESEDARPEDSLRRKLEEARKFWRPR